MLETRNVQNATVSVGDVTVVKFPSGKVMSDQQIESIRQDLLVLVGVKKILLDLSGVDYLSDVAIGMLITFQKKVNSFDGILVIYGIHENVREKFKTANLDKFFLVAENKDMALLELVRAARNQLPFAERLKCACARHLGIKPELISSVEPIIEGSITAGLKISVEIRDRSMIVEWVQ